MKKPLFLALGVLCVLAAVVMYYVGNNSGHLSELKDFFWVPLPLAAISFIIYLKK